MEGKVKVLIACMLSLSTVFFYQACGYQNLPTDSKHNGLGVTSEPEQIGSSTIGDGRYAGGIDYILNGDNDEEILSSAEIPAGGVTVSQDANCEAQCKIDLCDGVTGASNITSCENECSTDAPGLCASTFFESDPLAMKSFTIPAGYKKASITFEACMRNATLVLEGSSLRLEGNTSCVGSYYYRWSSRRRLSVHREVRGFAEAMNNSFKIQTYNDDGTKGAEYPLYWSRPGLLGFSLTMIPDADLGEPLFMIPESVKNKNVGRLTKSYFRYPKGMSSTAVYNNYLPNGQLSFVTKISNFGIRQSYWFRRDEIWRTTLYPRPVTVKFDVYYKKGTNPVANAEDFQDIINQ